MLLISEYYQPDQVYILMNKLYFNDQRQLLFINNKEDQFNAYLKFISQQLQYQKEISSLLD